MAQREAVTFIAMQERSDSYTRETCLDTTPASVHAARRRAVGFFGLGLLNNMPYVIILTAALELLPPHVPTGLVAFANIAPALLAKGIFPYLLKGEIRYTRRVTFCVLAALTGMLVRARLTIDHCSVGVAGRSSMRDCPGQLCERARRDHLPAIRD